MINHVTSQKPILIFHKQDFVTRNQINLQNVVKYLHQELLGRKTGFGPS